MIDLKSLRINNITKKILFVLAGAGLGFAYYYFIGCTTGSCPISSNPYIATAYGAISGLVLSSNTKKEDRVSEKNNQA